jgi:broad specificity phosphatase PhoE
VRLYMNNTLQIPSMPFYFIRHGETDWNKTRQDLCDRDDIELNQTGIEQVEKIHPIIETLGITHIYSSPLKRTEQIAANNKYQDEFEYRISPRFMRYYR